MNSQRSVIYAKRRNALFGERLDVDLSNTILDVIDDIVNEFKGANNNYEGFKLELIRVFAFDMELSEDEFTSFNAHALVDHTYQSVMSFYKHKTDAVAQQAYPVIKDVYETRGNEVESIVVPFTDGIHGMQVAVPLKKAVETHGNEVWKSFEKNVSLDSSASTKSGPILAKTLLMYSSGHVASTTKNECPL